MAIIIKGSKVAGVGTPGKSAYQVAIESGYTGTEQEFNNILATAEERILAAEAVAETKQDKIIGTAGQVVKFDKDGNLIGEDAVSADTIIEINNNLEQRFWRGTKAEYDAIEDKDESVLYIVTDGDEDNDIDFQDILNSHIENTDIHVTAEEKTNWNNKATTEYVDEKIAKIPTPDVSGQIGEHNEDNSSHPYILEELNKKENVGAAAAVQESLNLHTSNIDIHVTNEDKINWNNKTTEEYVNQQIGEHNVSSDSHNDVRLLIKNLSDRLNTLANSDDTTLDQMAEVVAYIKNNKNLIDAITTSKINVDDIIDNLTTNVSNKPLSAAQGVALKTLIDAINVPTTPGEVGADASGTATSKVNAHNTSTSAHSDIRTSITDHSSNKNNPHGVTKSQVGLGNVDNTSDANKPVSTAQQTAIDAAKKAGTDAQSNLNNHTSNKSNPHGVTLSQLGVNATATELNYVDGVTSAIQTQLNGKTSTAVLPNNNGEIKTKFRIAQKGHTNGATWYYKICDLPTNGTSNYASAIMSGRIGGWTSNNMSYVNALVWNRDTPGIALIDIAGSATAMSSIWNVADLVLYVNGTSTTATNTATLYVKCNGYFTFDFDLELFQSDANITYNGTYITTTPTGTLAAQSSTTSKRVEVVNGKLLVNGSELAFSNYVNTKFNAIPDWAKAANKPTYTASEVGAATPAYIDEKIAAIPGIDDAIATSDTLWSSQKIIDFLCYEGGEAYSTVNGNTSGGGSVTVNNPVVGSLLNVSVTIDANPTYSKTPNPNSSNPLQGWSSVSLTHTVGTNMASYDINFGCTVYGGFLNCTTGVLTITHKIQYFDGTEDWKTISDGLTWHQILHIDGISPNPNRKSRSSEKCSHYAICTGTKLDGFTTGICTTSDGIEIYDPNYDQEDPTAWKNRLATLNANGDPLHVVIKLNEPYTIQLDPIQIFAFKGENIVRCSIGSFSVSYWEDFRYELQQIKDNYIPIKEKGKANGVATLETDGKIPESQLPDKALTSTKSSFIIKDGGILAIKNE